MVRAWWRAGALVSLSILVLSWVPAVSAGYPHCRDVTEPAIFTPEGGEGNYLAFLDGEFQEWKEFNGYLGLQRQKCLTETGLLLGSDGFQSTLDPGDINVPDVTICDAPPGTTLGKQLKACLDELPGLPDDPEPNLPGGGEFCDEGFPQCIPFLGEFDPGITYEWIDWLQFILGHTLQGVLGSLPDP